MKNTMIKIINSTKNIAKKTIDHTTASLKDMKEIYEDLPQETQDGCKLTAGVIGLSVASSVTYKKNKKLGLAMYGGAIAMYIASMIKYDQGCERAEREWHEECERLAKDIIYAPTKPECNEGNFEKEVKKAAEEAEQKAKEPKIGYKWDNEIIFTSSKK